MPSPRASLPSCQQVSATIPNTHTSVIFSCCFYFLKRYKTMHMRKRSKHTTCQITIALYYPHFPRESRKRVNAVGVICSASSSHSASQKPTSKLLHSRTAAGLAGHTALLEQDVVGGTAQVEKCCHLGLMLPFLVFPLISGIKINTSDDTEQGRSKN